MMRAMRLILVRALPILCACLALSLAGCGDSKKAKSDKTKPNKDPRSTKGVNVGDSCKGIGASEGLIACDGAKSLGCSSFTSYAWKVISTCEKGEKCVKQGKDMTTCSAKASATPPTTAKPKPATKEGGP